MVIKHHAALAVSRLSTPGMRPLTNAARTLSTTARPLIRIHRQDVGRSVLYRRSYAKSTSKSNKGVDRNTRIGPSNKLCYREFAVMPDEALTHSRILALWATKTLKSLIKGAIARLPGKFFGWKASRFMLDQFKLDAELIPTVKLRAVYWPTWLTHVVLDLRKPAKANMPLVLGIEECLPGHSFSPLSLLNLPVQDDDGPEGDAVGTLVYDENSAKDQLHEYGQSIEIIPFSVDPTKVRRHILKAKKLYEQGQKDAEWTVLSEIKEVMTVAAPIYFPLYIAEWTRPKIDSFPERKVTVVVSGQYDGVSDDHPYLWHPFPPQFPNELRQGHYWVGQRPHYKALGLNSHEDTPPPFADIEIGSWRLALTLAWLRFAWSKWMFPVTPECHDGEASHLIPVQSPLAKFDVDEASIDWGNDMIQSVRSEQWRITGQWASEVEQHRGGGGKGLLQDPPKLGKRSREDD